MIMYFETKKDLLKEINWWIIDIKKNLINIEIKKSDKKGYILNVSEVVLKEQIK